MKTKKIIILLGDLIILYLSLAITLTIRYREFDFNIFQIRSPRRQVARRRQSLDRAVDVRAAGQSP